MVYFCKAAEHQYVIDQNINSGCMRSFENKMNAVWELRELEGEIGDRGGGNPHPSISISVQTAV